MESDDEGWSDPELMAAVDAYFWMRAREVEGQEFSKAAVYRQLEAEFGRAAKAFEFRMQNISSVVADLGEKWVTGLKPRKNIGANVRPRLEGIVKNYLAETAAPLYKQLIGPMRDWLIGVARQRGRVTYGDVMGAFGIGHRNLRRSMSLIGGECKRRGEPILTALIVNKSTGRCSQGFDFEFGVADDEHERERLYTYWSATQASSSPRHLDSSVSMEVKAARFVSVEARPDQAAFRRRVFLACGGKCVITGCDLIPAIDAAHKRGRKWREGHNNAEDGWLLRKDLHALYDRKLLDIGPDGTLSFAATALPHYQHLVGRRVNILA